MEMKQAIEVLLGLGPKWKLLTVSYLEAEGCFDLKVRETQKLWEGLRCAGCGAEGVRCYDHVPEREWRHMDIMGKQSIIRCSLPRGHCKSCNLKYRIKPPWEGESKHFSKDFEGFALKLMKEMPSKSAGRILGEHDTRLTRMLELHVSLAHKSDDWSKVRYIGVDELSHKKGHRYITVFSDMESRRVLFATEGKDASVWDVFGQELLRHNGNPWNIQLISMDMSPAYIAGSKAVCPGAELVFDKFHVIMNANNAVDAIRRDEARRGHKDARHQLKNTRWCWRKNPGNLTSSQQKLMDRLDHEMLVTSKAYQMKLVLQQIYSMLVVPKVKKKLKNWCQWVLDYSKTTLYNLFKPMANVAKMIRIGMVFVPIGSTGLLMPTWKVLTLSSPL